MLLLRKMDCSDDIGKINFWNHYIQLPTQMVKKYLAYSKENDFSSATVLQWHTPCYRVTLLSLAVDTDNQNNLALKKIIHGVTGLENSTRFYMLV